MHARAVERLARFESEWKEKDQKHRQRLAEALETQRRLKKKVADLKALLKLREKQAFGKKSERRGRLSPTSKKEKRRPGQQPGAPGHGRLAYDHLPEVPELVALAPELECCPKCHRPRAKKSDSEAATIVEIEVKAHRRRIRCERRESTCDCEGEPKLVVAPRPGQLIARGLLGVSVWVHVLLDKFLHQRPTYRLLDALRLYGLDLARGTVTDGLRQLAPLLAPIAEGIRGRVRGASHWHADETGWYVFADKEGKKGHHWFLWVFVSPDAVSFELDPTRSSEVVREVPGEDARGILSVDRFSAYKAFMKSVDGRVVLAFCWAHVRRDFLALALSRPELAAWANEWVDRIGRLYELNEARLAVRAAAGDDAAQKRALAEHLSRMRTARCDELMTVPSKGPQEKLLRSLGRHWDGLTLFVEHPWIPLDNSAAERAHRGPVVGRKNYYGSRAEWAGELAADLFGIFQTLRRNGLNPRLWLTAYLQACADQGGKAPPDAASHLPWNLTDERGAHWALQSTRTRLAPRAPSPAAAPAATGASGAGPACPAAAVPEAIATAPEAAPVAPPAAAPEAIAAPAGAAPEPTPAAAPAATGAPGATPEPASAPEAALAPAPTSATTRSPATRARRSVLVHEPILAPKQRADALLRKGIRRARARGDPPDRRRSAPHAGGHLPACV